MKKIIYTGTLVLLLGANSIFAQSPKTKLVYPIGIHTQESIKELNRLTENNTDTRQRVLKEIKELEKDGKTVLSTREYAPIKARINSNSKNPTTESEIEMNEYVKEVKKNYIVITDLLK